MTTTEALDILLSIDAIHFFYGGSPFVWASGWKSPVYCDNRLILSNHEARKKIRNGLVSLAQTHFPEPDVIAGVATGAIAMGALVADAMHKPFAYVRPKPKDHGMGNQIEGSIPEGSKVLIVEDLISTGGSSLAAAAAVRDAGAEILGMVAIFTYDFPVAQTNFKHHNVLLYTLANYPALIELLANRHRISTEQLETLAEWRKAPEKWHN